MPSFRESANVDRSRLRMATAEPGLRVEPGPRALPSPPLEFAPSPFRTSSLPGMAAGADAYVRQFYGGPLPQMRVMPLPAPQGKQTVETTTTKIITVQATGPIAQQKAALQGLTLETNGALNPNQAVLNLKAGSGVALVANSNGDVTITAAPKILSVSGTINGVNTSFTLSASCTVLLLFKNGELQDPADYSYVSGATTFTLVTAPVAGDNLNAVGF